RRRRGSSRCWRSGRRRLCSRLGLLRDWSNRRFGFSGFRFGGNICARRFGLCRSTSNHSLFWRSSFTNGLGTQLGLQFGKLVILELHQPLQLLQLTFEIFQAVIQIKVLTTTGVETFFGSCQPVAQRFGVGSGAGVAAGRGLAGFRCYQSQAVTRLATRWRRTRCATLAGIELAFTDRLSTPLAPAGILLSDLLDSFGLGATGDLLRTGQAQHLAVFHPIDVAADEGIRVQVLNRQHCLMDRTALPCALGDFPECVVRSDLVFITRWRSGSRRTSRRRLRGCAWCSGRPSNRSGSWQLRRDGR